jgi:hypothetical protein
MFIFILHIEFKKFNKEQAIEFKKVLNVKFVFQKTEQKDYLLRTNF